MRVCHVAAIPYGGHLPDFDEQPLELARAGIDVHVVCTEDQAKAIPAHGRLPEVHVVPLPASAFGADGLLWAQAVKRVLRTLEPDIVHVYAFRGASLLPTRRPGPAWIYDLRTGTIANPLRAGIGNRLSRWESAPYDQCITIHDALARRVWGPTYSDRVTVVPLGADFDRFSPRTAHDPERTTWRRELGLDPADHVIVYMGSLSPARNPGQLLTIAAQLTDVPHLRWLVAGHGSSVDALRYTIRTIGLSGRVQVLGRVPYCSTHRIYGASDIGLAYVPTTRAFDVQPPLKTIEMLASGLPVVATATRGNAVFIRDGITGYLCPDDSVALAAALRRALAALPSLQAAVLDDRPRLEHYSWRRIVADLLMPLYEQLLRGRRFIQRARSPADGA